MTQFRLFIYFYRLSHRPAERPSGYRRKSNIGWGAVEWNRRDDRPIGGGYVPSRSIASTRGDGHCTTADGIIASFIPGGLANIRRDIICHRLAQLGRSGIASIAHFADDGVTADVTLFPAITEPIDQFATNARGLAAHQPTAVTVVVISARFTDTASIKTRTGDGAAIKSTSDACEQ